MSSRSKNEQLMLTALFKKTFADETFRFHTVWTGWYFGRYSAWTRLDHPHCRWVLFMVCVFGFTMIVASEPGGMNHDNYQIWYLHVHSVLWKDSPQKVRRFRFQVVFQLLSRAEQGQPYGELGALTVSHEKTRASLSWLKFANSGTVRTTRQLCQGQGNRWHLWIPLNPFESNKLRHFWFHCSTFPKLVACTALAGTWANDQCLASCGCSLGLLRNWGSQNVTARCTLTSWLDKIARFVVLVIQCILALAQKRNVRKETSYC
jgi:hypothetical protein